MYTFILIHMYLVCHLTTLYMYNLTHVCDAKGQEDGGEGPEGAPQVGVRDLRHKHAHTELATTKMKLRNFSFLFFFLHQNAFLRKH